MVVYLDNGCLFMNEAQMILLTVWICFERFWVGLDGPVRWSSAQTRLAGWGLTPGLIMLIHHMISKYSGYNRIYIYIYIRTLIYKLCIQMYSAYIYIYIHIQSGTTLRISSSGNNSCASLYSYIQDHRRPSLVTWRRLREAEVSAWVLEGSDGEVECTGYHRRIIFCF